MKYKGRKKSKRDEDEMDEKHKTHDLSHGECAQCDDVLTNKKNKKKRTYTQMLVLMLLNLEVPGNGHVATSPLNHLKNAEFSLLLHS